MAQSKKTNKKKEKRQRFSFFSNIDPDKKSLILKVLGLIVGIFAIFTLVASVSYLLTWQEDQSIMSESRSVYSITSPVSSVRAMVMVWS